MICVLLQHTSPPHKYSPIHLISTAKFGMRIFRSHIKQYQQFYKSHTSDMPPAQTIFVVFFPAHFSIFHFMEPKKVGKNKRQWWYQTVSLCIHSIWQRYGWETKNWASITGRGNVFSLAQRPVWLWGSPSLRPNVWRGILSGSKVA